MRNIPEDACHGIVLELDTADENMAALHKDTWMPKLEKACNDSILCLAPGGEGKHCSVQVTSYPTIHHKNHKVHLDEPR